MGEDEAPLAPPTPWLRLRLLGGCEIRLPDGPARLETAKTRALLAYLLLNPGAQSRQRLVGLLWGKLPEDRARRNLRRALWNLRRQLHTADHPPPFRADRETVAFDRTAAYTLDVEQFEAACARPDRLEEAMRLYRGELLAGLSLPDAPPFEEWLLIERERLRLLALQALQRLVEQLAAQDDLPRALAYARQLLAMEPWREESHRQLMRLLARDGQRSAALAQYERCRRLLREELGVEPAAETTALYHRLRAGKPPPARPRLPAPLTPFIGRRRELEALTAMLTDPRCRLITLVGLGGIGKSRLALEAASRLPYESHYIELNELEEGERLPVALAQALGLPLLGVDDPLAALRAFLRRRPRLLILDGFEQLVDEAPLLHDLLSAAPALRLLVTSRRRLGVRGEWLYEVQGLPPDEAARLFRQTAQRLHRSLPPEAEERAIERICHLVDGHPLALEMAAAWTRLLPPARIAEEIAARLDFLGSAQRDRPARHRTIRAVLEESWQQLPPEAQRTLARLSTFRGPFRHREALRVAESNSLQLAALIDGALLQRLPDGRYRLHSLVRRYAAERLGEHPEEAAQAAARHACAYAAPLQRYREDRSVEGRSAMLRWLLEEGENVRAAWVWAAQHARLDVLETMEEALTDAHHLTANFREGERLFREALAALPSAGDARLEALRWKLRSHRAAFAAYLGRFEEAQAELVPILDHFLRYGQHAEAAQARFFLAEIARFRGEAEQARQRYAASLEAYRRLGDRIAEGFCLNGMGLAAVAMGKPEAARRELEASLAIFCRIHHTMGEAIAGANLAALLLALDEREAAREALERSAALFHRLGHRWGEATCLRHRGDLARREGDRAQAESDYRRALHLLEEIGQRQGMLLLLLRLGELHAEGGRREDARRDFEQAVRLAAELGDRERRLQAEAALQACAEEAER